MRRSAVLAMLVLAAGGLLAACDDDDVDAAREEVEERVDEARADLSEAAVRNLAAVNGAQAFEDEGYAVQDERLDCTAAQESAGDDTIEIECEGETGDGRQLVLTGTAESIDVDDDLEGSFVGRVDGDEVFDRDCLGC